MSPTDKDPYDSGLSDAEFMKLMGIKQSQENQMNGISESHETNKTERTSAKHSSRLVLWLPLTLIATVGLYLLV